MARTTVSKLFISLAILGILGCMSVDFTGEWQINIKASPSGGSRFYVLHDWQNTYSNAEVSPFPATDLSDIMLKTMGILKDGINWAGVVMGNLFSRPSATALFVIDGLSSKTSIESLSEMSFDVDQNGLTGCTCEDMKRMFEGDNVATHLSGLFDHSSQTHSVSANTHAAEAAAAQDSFTTESQLEDLVQAVQQSHISLADYGLEEAAAKLDISNKVDAHFIAELVLVRQAVQQLEELKSYVRDGAPDVYVFTISTLRNVESRYGAGSSKAKLAAKLVKDTIFKASQQLVSLYNQRILVQALVLEWDYPELSGDSAELSAAYEVLQPHLDGQSKESFLAGLPKVSIDTGSFADMALCSKLTSALRESSYLAHCPTPTPLLSSQSHTLYKSRNLRQAAPEEVLGNVTVASNSLVEGRSDNFAAIFLITLFIMVSMGLALFATSWAMWTMDPGRDSIIYRQVSDPTGDGIQMK
ncbi:uncharacterized protein LOC135341623 [Halichondria panicea]|uniref:uncharacterized protein LOC135341623 n=1 Tax=Halichondria panicea TaxID=6063 RepID=UPI00312B45A3